MRSSIQTRPSPGLDHVHCVFDFRTVETGDITASLVCLMQGLKVMGRMEWAVSSLRSGSQDTTNQVSMGYPLGAAAPERRTGAVTMTATPLAWGMAQTAAEATRAAETETDGAFSLEPVTSTDAAPRERPRPAESRPGMLRRAVKHTEELRSSA